jgi:hypothetical protein
MVIKKKWCNGAAVENWAWHFACWLVGLLVTPARMAVSSKHATSVWFSEYSSSPVLEKECNQQNTWFLEIATAVDYSLPGFSFSGLIVWTCMEIEVLVLLMELNEFFWTNDCSEMTGRQGNVYAVFKLLAFTTSANNFLELICHYRCCVYLVYLHPY